VVVPRAEELHQLEVRRGAEELPAHAPGQAQVVLGVAGGLDELRRAGIGHHELVAGRRHRAGHLEDHRRLRGREQDLLGHQWSPVYCWASGTVAVTTGTVLTTRVECPWPVV